MAVRIIQVYGLWVWVAFAFFIFVLFHQSHSPLPHSTGRPSTVKERMMRAEKAWETSVNLRHEMAHKHPGYPRIPLFPAQTLEAFGKYPYTIWDFFPPVYTCPHDIQRVGHLGDGGKWVCGMSLYENRPAPPVSKAGKRTKPGTVIYSFGVNGDSSFEAEMLARVPSAEIFAYDYTVASFGPQIAGSDSSRAYFKQVGLDRMDVLDRTPPFMSLQSLMKNNSHTYMDILKIDIEGAEYNSFDSFMDWCDRENAGEMPIGQIMIELHLTDDDNLNFNRLLTWWERLEKFGMRPTWLEVNLLAVTLNPNKQDPRCVEYVLVNHKDRKNIMRQES
ncbi:hypothetical protein HYALB_00011233 [Hymenoscyphus albidus]|uniref:Methyltransferase domain-containing protein n=1 Tax=Hymenoscyphus albidus TaxID=595503 RepID=A0A9N9LGC6_9HELO|nr:hypothetical protein HYALB_00011233 [Hymenoscyphus albidus]